MAERVSFTTDDGVIIVGDWYPTPTMLGVVILLHMMPAMRSSWALFQRELAKKGIASLAIDLRGHGDSTMTNDQLILDYREFEDRDHQASLADALAAVEWVKGRGVDEERIAMAGASIGANLAIETLVEDPDLAGAALLSPGSDYNGINALAALPEVLPHQSLFIVSSEDDAQSFNDSKNMFEAAPVENKVFLPYKNAGHGTAIFTADKALMGKMADWFVETVKGS